MPSTSTSVKRILNFLLGSANLKIQTRAHEEAELERLRRLEVRGRFDAPHYDLPAFDSLLGELKEAYAAHGDHLRVLLSGRGATGYDSRNPWFFPADAGVLYLTIRHRKPRLIVEIGSGNSTMVSRQAIIDGQLSTRIEAVDPAPRADVRGLVDQLHLCRLEDLPSENSLREQLRAGDLLFIDSSHETAIGGDVVQLFLEWLPRLPAGVIVHVHDIFLPYEYPRDLVFDQGVRWSEQYLLQAFLHDSRHRILWPGYHMQRDRAEALTELPFLTKGRAQSFWFECGDR